ncbi:hypothetical protein [Vannielia litorea]|uniref:Uncharacterized protein n=1 Tax=Vannielia litorea TaxID=1217970 RepID=A0A1N6EU48_9RHOB|nr:hypothetical protein [Vannielia litorea]SIN86443.1 hypothetical protein SAMN05444002_1096 [Vannielia litorea]
MKRVMFAALLGLFPLAAQAGDALMVNALHSKEHGGFSVSCDQTVASSQFSSWDRVPVLCAIAIHPEQGGFAHLGSVTVGAEEVVFDLYRDRNDQTYIGYTIEQGGRVIWALPEAARAAHGYGNPISGSERRAFMAAMQKAARSGGVLRLRFQVAYSGGREVDLKVPLRKWRAALRDVKRAAQVHGAPTAPW